MNIRPYVILSAALNAVTTSAAVPLSWTVETSRVQPAVFDAVRGESIELEATLQRYGKSVAIDPQADWKIYWQTNGMDDAWWSAPATASSGDPATAPGRLTATFTPAMDPGAPAVNGFIGSPGNNYRAAFTLRFRHGPGATPNAIAKPVPVLDLANTVVINAPWPTDETIKSVVRDVVAETGVSGGVDTNAVERIANRAVETNAVTVATTNRVTNLETATNNLASSVSGLRSSKLDGPTDTTLAQSGKAADAKATGDALSRKLSIVSEHPYLISTDMTGEIRATFTFAEDGLLEVEKDILFTDTYETARSLISAKADREELEPLSEDIHAAYQYARTVSLYMTGNTNAWFAGTNYVLGADAEARTHFAWEPGMDAATVPCSMALWEIRDGVRQCVWDQRDWPTWYWSFKAAQMKAEFNASNEVFQASVNRQINADENHAWAKRYASTGRRNPDASTTFIDTPSVTLSPGMSWETVATVGGCGYWTIVGNGAVIGGSGTNATLNVKDFEGNSILEVTKGQHMLAWLEASDFVGQMTDSDGWICFDMMANVKPTGYFSTTLVASDSVAETDENCPAQYRWEDLGGHVWRIHFLLKPGIVSDACFAKFQVEVEGKTQIRYNADTVINGGLIFDGVKIAPVIQSGAAVGSTVTWKVVK